MNGTGEQARSGRSRGVVRWILRRLASKKPAGQKLLHDYAVPAGVGIAAGVVAGAIVVKVVGLTIVMGVATGIITAACTFSNVTDALTEARQRPSAST